MVKKIVVFDEDVLSFQIEEHILKQCGFEVILLQGNSNIIEQIVQLQPDLILLDMFSSSFDSLEICKKIRQTKELKQIHIIILSSKAYESDKNRAYEFGADGYILKPLTEDKFLNV